MRLVYFTHHASRPFFKLIYEYMFTDYTIPEIQNSDVRRLLYKRNVAKVAGRGGAVWLAHLGVQPSQKPLGRLWGDANGRMHHIFWNLSVGDKKPE